MTDITEEQFAAVQALPPAERYAYFLRYVTESEELWTLRNAEDFVMYSDENGRELVPVWPHRRFAEACADSAWDETVAFKIDLDRWLAAWTPGLETEGRLVAVFPLANDQGVIVSPEQLAADLEKLP
ncbi:DUF2750 domain-containing protein [Anatilimnocola floriformis]|uniref:DUF2750 domain-containing protein n=1 Tax=Anatilimnocola floriformis TaxID=2948575 RepID=UPI0020C2C06C|nr:DUF2750 domain-containing protein [Anatilimnocola floriformis]